MDVKFDNLMYLHLLWLVPALFGVALYGFASRRRLLERFAASQLLQQLAGQFSRSKQWAKSLLLLGAVTALVLGAVGPRWGRYYEEVPRRGIDIIFVLDVSRSMLAGDLPPNRLARAKQ